MKTTKIIHFLNLFIASQPLTGVEGYVHIPTSAILLDQRGWKAPQVADMPDFNALSRLMGGGMSDIESIYTITNE